MQRPHTGDVKAGLEAGTEKRESYYVGERTSVLEADRSKLTSRLHHRLDHMSLGNILHVSEHRFLLQNKG